METGFPPSRSPLRRAKEGRARPTSPPPPDENPDEPDETGTALANAPLTFATVDATAWLKLPPVMLLCQRG